MALVTHAQAANNARIQQIKEKATSELDRRIANFEKTLKSLSLDSATDSDGTSTTVSSDNGTATGAASKDGVSVSGEGAGGSVSASVGTSGIDFNIEVSQELKDKIKGYMTKLTDRLKELKDEVKQEDSLAGIQDLAKLIDTQHVLDQVANVQGAVTKSVETMTGIVEQLKTTADDIQGQLTKIRECATGVASGDGSLDIQADKEGATATGSAPGCDDFTVSSEEITAQLEEQLSTVNTSISSIATVVTSAVTLLVTLSTNFSDVLSQVGDLDKLTGSLTDITKLSSVGNVGGLLTSFNAITSQLDIASMLSGATLTDMTGIFEQMVEDCQC